MVVGDQGFAVNLPLPVSWISHPEPNRSVTSESHSDDLDLGIGGRLAAERNRRQSDVDLPFQGERADGGLELD